MCSIEAQCSKNFLRRASVDVSFIYNKIEDVKKWAQGQLTNRFEASMLACTHIFEDNFDDEQVKGQATDIIRVNVSRSLSVKTLGFDYLATPEEAKSLTATLERRAEFTKAVQALISDTSDGLASVSSPVASRVSDLLIDGFEPTGWIRSSAETAGSEKFCVWWAGRVGDVFVPELNKIIYDYNWASLMEEWLGQASWEPSASWMPTPTPLPMQAGLNEFKSVFACHRKMFKVAHSIDEMAPTGPLLGALVGNEAFGHLRVSWGVAACTPFIGNVFAAAKQAIAVDTKSTSIAQLAAASAHTPLWAAEVNEAHQKLNELCDEDDDKANQMKVLMQAGLAAHKTVMVKKANEWRDKKVKHMEEVGCTEDNDVTRIVDMADELTEEVLGQLQAAAKCDASKKLFKEWTAFVRDHVKYQRVLSAADAQEDEEVLSKVKSRLACLGACQAIGPGQNVHKRVQAKQQFETLNVPVPAKLGVFLQAP